jgi:ferredoxin
MHSDDNLGPFNQPSTSMANLSDRLSENASGRYYVDSSCIDCDQCRVIAPDFFARNEESGLSFVSKQPETAEDVSRLEEAIAACASGSIGDDGA